MIAGFLHRRILCHPAFEVPFFTELYPNIQQVSPVREVGRVASRYVFVNAARGHRSTNGNQTTTGINPMQTCTYGVLHG